MNNDYRRLLDIQEAIERIEKYTEKGKEEFQKDELIQTWIIHHLQIIGEAVGKVTDDLRENYPEIPWKKIRGMRNILVHDYFGIDFDIVWNVIEIELPDLKRNINHMIDKEQP